MSKEWFRIAKQVDRLKGKALAPAGDQIKSLSFRKKRGSGKANNPRKKTKKRRGGGNPSRP